VMRAVMMSILFSFAVEAAPGYQQVRPQVPNVFRAPVSAALQRLNPSHHHAFPIAFPVAQELRSPLPGSSRDISARAEEAKSTDVEAKNPAEPKKEEPAKEEKAGSAPKYINVFEEELATCLPATYFKEADYCTFRSASPTSHEICVAELNPSSTRAGWEWWYDKDIKCIKIENMDPYADPLKPFDFTGSGGFRWGGIKLTEFHPKCEALPAGVLQSEWTLDMMQGGNLATKKYTDVSPSSSESTPETRAMNDKKIETRMVDSVKRPKVIDAIQKICDVCRVQATSEKAKASLGSKCDAALALRPQETSFEPFSIAKKKRPFDAAEEAEDRTGFIGLPALMLIGFMCSGVAIVVHRSRRSAPTMAEERLLVA